MYSLIRKYHKILLAVFLDVIIFFLLGFLGFQLERILVRSPTQGAELAVRIFASFIIRTTVLFTFILQVLALGFIHRKLLQTKKEVIVTHLLFFISSSALPLYYLIAVFQEEIVRSHECQVEMSSGIQGIACSGGEGFGITLFILFMVISYIFVLAAVSLFINYHSLNLKALEYKKFIIKTTVVLCFLGIVFISIIHLFHLISEPQRPKVIEWPQAITPYEINLSFPNQQIVK